MILVNINFLYRTAVFRIAYFNDQIYQLVFFIVMKNSGLKRQFFFQRLSKVNIKSTTQCLTDALDRY